MEALVQMPEIKSELKVDEYTPVGLHGGHHDAEHQLEGHVGHVFHQQHHHSQWVSAACCLSSLYMITLKSWL